MKPLDVPESVRLLNATIAQWRAALECKIDLGDKSLVELLEYDFECMANAMQAITDWAP